MEAERWERVARLYEEVSERPPDEWNAFLSQACHSDDELRREVESLLAQDVSGHGVLEHTAGLGLLSSVGEHPLPASIGRYRILSLVGEGGMGVVFEAEQDHPRRIVALKVVRLGLGSTELRRRFQRESEALARLQHPGIAQIYEAGAADTGYGVQPYFAMEFIRGLSLIEYARQHRLNDRQRLQVMAKVCDAAHHAHQRGIIHRDLKPSNILVDDTGQPKILDFGVSRVIGSYGADSAATESNNRATRQTSLGDLVGTLEYMSPEQAVGDPGELDARSDVYALGVVLYELLAGRLPYQLSNKVHEAARIILEQEPAPLRTTNRSWRGDLETIVNKALHKDKTRRYDSAASLSDDLLRYLADRPVLARPPAAGYHLRKFSQRHKGVAIAVLGLFAVLVGGVTASTWEAVRANRAERAALAERDRVAAAERRTASERDRAVRAEQEATGERIRAEQDRNLAIEERRRANTQSATAKAVSDFLQDDLLAQAGARAQSGPNTRPDPELKVRTALDRAAAQIGGKFAAQPLVEAAIRQTIGKAYEELGLYAESEQQLERALELRRRVQGAPQSETLTSMFDLASLYRLEGKLGAAEGLLTLVLEGRRRTLGEEHRDTLAAMNELALILVSRRDDERAERVLAGIFQIERRVLGDEDADTLAVMNDLAAEYVNRGKYSQAEELYKEVLKRKRRVLGAEHPSTLLSMNSLGVVYRNQGKYTEAEGLLGTVLEVRRRVMGDRHNDTLTSMNSLAMVYQAEGRYAQAEPLLEQVVEVRRSVLGGDHLETLATMNNLADLYRRQNRRGEAEALLEAILEARRRLLGPENPSTINALASLGGVMMEQQRYAEAELLLREAVMGYQKSNPGAWRRYYTESLLGATLAHMDRYAEAGSRLASGARGMTERQESIPFESRGSLDEVRQWMVELRQRSAKPQEAAESPGLKP